MILRNLESEHAVGEVCCRFFDQEGIPVYPELQERTISITLEELRRGTKHPSLWPTVIRKQKHFYRF